MPSLLDVHGKSQDNCNSMQGFHQVLGVGRGNEAGISPSSCDHVCKVAYRWQLATNKVDLISSGQGSEWAQAIGSVTERVAIWPWDSKSRTRVQVEQVWSLLFLRSRVK